jgi:predicted acyltransferase
VLFTSGWAFMSLAACILIVDVHGYTKIAKFGIVYGSNAISIYVLAGLLPYLLYTVLGVKGFFFDELVNLGVAPKTASALWSVLYVLLLYIPAYIMYKKKIFIKV